MRSSWDDYATVSQALPHHLYTLPDSLQMRMMARHETRPRLASSDVKHGEHSTVHR